jgi:hypothetical protein
VLRVAGHELGALAGVGVLDGRRGRLLIERADHRAKLDATGHVPDPRVVRFVAEELGLRLVCDVLEVDHVRTDLHPLPVEPVVSRVTRSPAGDPAVLGASCAVADITPALAAVLTGNRRGATGTASGWSSSCAR